MWAAQISFLKQDDRSLSFGLKGQKEALCKLPLLEAVLEDNIWPQQAVRSSFLYQQKSQVWW
jgi:hypothetical protein